MTTIIDFLCGFIFIVFIGGIIVYVSIDYPLLLLVAPVFWLFMFAVFKVGFYLEGKMK